MTRSRAVSPVVGTVCLVACCVAGSAVSASRSSTPAGTRSPVPSPVALHASASADGTIRLTYRAGPPLDVRTLRVHVTVAGTPLREQPPVPFVGAAGFRGAPSGPFNAASDATWGAGEPAGFRVAGTNSPALAPGSRVVVALYRGGQRVAVAATTVTPRERARGS